MSDPTLKVQNYGVHSLNETLYNKPIMVHHKPIMHVRFPFLLNNTRGPGEAEMPQNPAELHAHLHRRHILTCIDHRAVRKGEKKHGRICILQPVRP